MNSSFIVIFKIGRMLLKQIKNQTKGKVIEMLSRSAINRFYYSTFLILREKMVEFNKNKDPNYQMEKSGKIHQDVYNYIKNNSDQDLNISPKKSILIHKKYQKLKKMRNKADYDFSLDINEFEAEKQYKNSKTIIKTIGG